MVSLRLLRITNTNFYIMKGFKFIALVILLVGAAVNTNAQKVVTEKFWVGGVCDMCKTRIEKALDVSGIKYASYDLEAHTLEVIYKANKISSEEIHKLLNDAGHDTDKAKASDEAYANIHGCCKYREHEHGTEKSCSASCKKKCEGGEDHDDHEHDEEGDDEDGH